jgi:predicted nucleic acid-binding Zn ribbon protein
MKRTAAIALLIAASAPALAASLDENALVKQIAQGMTSSELAVACRLRTSEWRTATLIGWFGMARIALMSAHPETEDGALSAKAMDILKAAKVQAAMDAQFAAPTNAQCDTLNASHDMKELDAAAKLGLMAGAVQ